MRTIIMFVLLATATILAVVNNIHGKENKVIVMEPIKITGHVNTVEKQKAEAVKVVDQILMHILVSKLYADENVLKSIENKIKTMQITK